jgi:glutamate N-acetyltransferase/amino-acid N-acetyltransferase
MAALAADGLRLSDKLVYVCSTGTIGKPLPMDKIEQGIADLVAAAHEQGGLQAARAMMTTDTREKYIVKEIELDGRQVRITGLAKGAGMIEPHMGTMLAFLLTDAAVEAQTLQDILRKAVSQSFNRVSVDGDQSTNDTVLFMANGRAGNTPLCADHPDTAVFADAVEQVTLDLAMKIASDGEGATRLVMVQVTGAEDDTQADQAARAVANSMLNKTAWAGGSANWGRIMDALGYSPARVKEERVDISYDDIPAVEGGISANPDSAELNAVMQKDCLTISIDLHLGHGRAIVYTCDCTEEYVRINM